MSRKSKLEAKLFAQTNSQKQKNKISINQYIKSLDSKLLKKNNLCKIQKDHNPGAKIQIIKINIYKNKIIHLINYL